jgi:probable F420-dependent oxidoreductase
VLVEPISVRSGGPRPIETEDVAWRLPVLGVWTAALDGVGISEAQELAGEIEELGYGVLWLPEVAGRDVMFSLGMLLAATSDLIGATGIASIWARDAVTMTGGVKALTEAFPDRVLLGLGVSHHTLVHDLRGHTYERPLAAMRTYLAAMDAAPYTARRPTTPVRRVLAALGPKMLALSAEKTSGAHTYFVPPDHTAEARGVLGDALLCVEQAVVLQSDPARAREIARMHAHVYVRLPNYQTNLRRLGFGDDDFAGDLSDRLVDAIVAWGGEEEITARVRAHLDAGADHVCVQALSAGRRDVPAEQWRALAPALVEAATRS